MDGDVTDYGRILVDCRREELRKSAEAVGMDDGLRRSILWGHLLEQTQVGDEEVNLLPVLVEGRGGQRFVVG